MSIWCEIALRLKWQNTFDDKHNRLYIEWKDNPIDETKIMFYNSQKTSNIWSYETSA